MILFGFILVDYQTEFLKLKNITVDWGQSTFLHEGCHMARVKRISAFEHAQNVRIHIIVHKRKVSPGSLLFIHIFFGIQ